MTRKEKIRYLINIKEGKRTKDDDKFVLFMCLSDNDKAYTEVSTGKFYTANELPKDCQLLTLDLSL